MKKEISVIIVTYNSETLIFDCIDSLYKHNDIGDMLEIIIVDNNSCNVNKMFSDIKERYGNDIILIKNEENKGYGHGNNVGIINSTAPVFMIMNPDVRLIAPIMSKACKVFKDESIAMLGMQQMYSENKKGLSFSCKTNASAYRLFFQTVICNKLNIYFQKSMFIMGACFFMRKSTFKTIGMFDESIFLYGEENDLHHRLIHSKIKCSRIVYSKQLKYLHLMENRPLSISTMEQNLKSELYFCEKNNLSKDKQITRNIKRVKILLVLEKFRKNTYRINVYKKWLAILNNHLNQHLQKT